MFVHILTIVAIATCRLFILILNKHATIQNQARPSNWQVMEVCLTPSIESTVQHHGIQRVCYTSLIILLCF